MSEYSPKVTPHVGMFGGGMPCREVSGWRQSACNPSHVLSLKNEKCYLRCSEHQEVIGIIRFRASGSKLKHRFILITRKNIADRIWCHGAIATEDKHIK